MRVAVIGGGAAGLMAAATASENNEVVIFEKNEKLAKKIYITWKGRCNVTNACAVDEFLKNVATNPKFLTSAIYSFSSFDLMEFIESNGTPLKTERGNRVFPVSDKASDVTKCFEKILLQNGVRIRLNTEVKEIVAVGGEIRGLKTADATYDFDKIIICTGRLSYPSTGSTGDGYRFAKKLGHTIIRPVASLTGLNLKGDEYKSLQGLTLKNVGVKILDGQKVVHSDFGEMLFTHFGVSGPVILTGSARINRLNTDGMKLSVDLKPAINEELLDARILRDFGENKNKDFSNALYGLLPRAAVGLIVERSGIRADKKVNEITAAERKKLLYTLKNLDFTIDSLRPIEEGVVTAGGVNVKEINPKTMESKLIKGLFFAGEVIDVDAFTGGFNLQIAFSTGRAAGKD